MDAIVTFLLIMVLSGITFMYTTKKEKRPIRKAFAGELDYLYTYRDLLHKIAQIENQLNNVTAHPYFRSIEISFIKQQKQATLRALINNYTRGITTADEAHAQLNELSTRITVLFSAVAA